MTDESQQAQTSIPVDAGGSFSSEQNGDQQIANDIEENMREFLDPGYNREAAKLDAEAEAEKAAAEDTAALEEHAAKSQSKATTPTQPAPSNAPVAEPPAQQEPQVDQELLATFLNLKTPEQQPVTPAAQPTAPAAPAAPEPYTPFPDTVAVPPQVLERLFNSDDPQVQAQTLGTLIAAIGNSVAQVMEQRIQSHHYGQIQSQAMSSFRQQSEAQRIDSDFYCAYPDLMAHRQLVTKGFQAVLEKNPGAEYSPEVRDRVGALVRGVLAKAGIQTQTPTPVVQPAVTPPTAAQPATAKKQPYVAGNARPGNYQQPNGSDPASMLEELSRF